MLYSPGCSDIEVYEYIFCYTRADSNSLKVAVLSHTFTFKRAFRLTKNTKIMGSYFRSLVCNNDCEVSLNR